MKKIFLSKPKKGCFVNNVSNNLSFGITIKTNELNETFVCYFSNFYDIKKSYFMNCRFPKGHGWLFYEFKSP